MVFGRSDVELIIYGDLLAGLLATYVFLVGVQDKSLKLVEAVVDSGPSTLLHNWFVTLQRDRQMGQLV